MNRRIPGVAFVSLVIVLGAPAPAAAQAQKEPEPPVIVTSGEGIVRSVPDRAHLSVAAESRARNPREAQRLNAEAMQAIQQRLKGARLPADAIRTTSYDLRPEFDYVNGKQILRGYLARNSIEVRVDDIERLGEIIDLSIGSGATLVTDVQFDLKNRETLEREALKRAVADARARAEAAAAGAGRTIDRVVRIEEHREQSYRPPRPMMLAMRADAADAPVTPVAPGQLEIRANVTLTVAIK